MRLAREDRFRSTFPFFLFVVISSIRFGYFVLAFLLLAIPVLFVSPLGNFTVFSLFWEPENWNLILGLQRRRGPTPGLPVTVSDRKQRTSLLLIQSNSQVLFNLVAPSLFFFFFFRFFLPFPHNHFLLKVSFFLYPAAASGNPVCSDGVRLF